MQKPSGKCDICNEAVATRWYGRTSAATCNSGACLTAMDDRYREHCAEMDRKAAFEKEMEDY